MDIDKIYLVTLEKQHTIEDLEKGMLGKSSLKDVLVKGKSKDEARINVQIDDGFNIKHIVSFDELLDQQLNDLVSYIINKY